MKKNKLLTINDLKKDLEKLHDEHSFKKDCNSQSQYTKEQSSSAIFLFNYMLSKFNVMYDMTGNNADSFYNENSMYYFQKLEYISRVIDEDFNGDFKQFVQCLKAKNMRDHYTLDQLKEIELTA